MTRDLELPESLEKRTPLAITMNQEVLLSYRLLFGSSAKSRKLAKEELTNLDDGNIDSLLIALCQESKPDIFSFLKKNSTIQELPSRSWPKPCLDERGRLQERSIYSAKHDFPRLGPRLMILQRYCSRQSSTDLNGVRYRQQNKSSQLIIQVTLVLTAVTFIVGVLQMLPSLMQWGHGGV